MISITQALSTFLAFLLLYFCYGAFFSPTSRYPGPFLAKFTNVWRLIDVWRGQHHETLRRLHAKHGSIVRVGPNLLSLSDPSWNRIVYSTKGEFKKTSYVSPNDVKIAKGVIIPTTFSVLVGQDVRTITYKLTLSRWKGQ